MLKKIVVSLICMMMLFGCYQNKNNQFPIQEETVVKTGRLIEIDYKQLKDKIKNNEEMILYIGRPDCMDCKEFIPVIEYGLGIYEDLEIYYLNTKAFRDASRKEDASQMEKDFYENIRTELSFTWTPTVQKRKGDNILSSYTYLETGYYDLENENEKKDTKIKAQETFIEWLQS